MTPKTSIVTLRTTAGDFETDYELSAHLPLGQLAPLVCESLAKQEPRRFARWKGLCFCRDGYPLPDSDTLSDLGIWDGGILNIEEGKP